MFKLNINNVYWIEIGMVLFCQLFEINAMSLQLNLCVEHLDIMDNSDLLVYHNNHQECNQK